MCFFCILYFVFFGFECSVHAMLYLQLADGVWPSFIKRITYLLTYLIMLMFANKQFLPSIITLLFVCLCLSWYSIFTGRQHTDALTRVIDIANLSVCLSVCPSVRPWRSGIKWKRLNLFVIVFTLRYPIILVLSASNIFTKFRRSHPCGSKKYRWV